MSTTQTSNVAEHGHAGQFTIVVNGRERKVTESKLSFEDLVKLAFGDNPPSGPNVVITVTYKSRGQEGTLLPGQSVDVQNGMIFNVKATDKS
jgi:hypothetical protein